MSPLRSADPETREDSGRKQVDPQSKSKNKRKKKKDEGTVGRNARRRLNVTYSQRGSSLNLRGPSEWSAFWSIPVKKAMSAPQAGTNKRTLTRSPPLNTNLSAAASSPGHNAFVRNTNARPLPCPLSPTPLLPLPYRPSLASPSPFAFIPLSLGRMGFRRR